MDKGAHADEATAVNVKYDCFWWRDLLLKDLLYALQVVFQIFAEDIELFLEEILLFVLEFLKFSHVKLKRVVDSNRKPFSMRFFHIKLLIILLPIVDSKVRQTCIVSFYLGKEVFSQCSWYVELFREGDGRK